MAGDQTAIKVTESHTFISDVVESKNMHAVTALELLFELRKEALENQSTDQSWVHPADVDRILKGCAELEDHIEWTDKRPVRDLPHSKNRVFKIEFVGLESKTNVQNMYWRDSGRLIDYAINEFSEGETIRQRSGINEFDKTRLYALLDDLRDIMARAVANTPMDKPASYPSEEDGSPGSQNSRPEYSTTLGG
jgi:hypothetical protein